MRLHLISGFLQLRAHHRDLIDRQPFALDLLSDRLFDGFQS
nr:hypothetical protein [Microbacterium proteolyticum]